MHNEKMTDIIEIPLTGTSSDTSDDGKSTKTTSVRNKLIGFLRNQSTISSVSAPDGLTVVDSGRNTFASKKSMAEGMMDIALLTANGNQLKFLFTYNVESQTYYLCIGLVILSLIIQVAVGIALIFKRHMKTKGRRDKANKTNEYLVVGVFLVTVINILVVCFTTTPKSN